MSNHPQPSEMYAYLGLGGDFICGVTLVQLRQTTRKNVAIKIRDLSGALKPFLTAGLKGIDLFCWKTSKWQMHFAVVDGVVRGPSNATYPPKLLHQAVLRHGTLQRLTVCTMHPTEVASLRELVDCNPGIYWIDIWFFRHELLSGIALIYQHWYGDPTELHIAVFEKGGKNEFRAVTKITIGNQTIAALEALHTGDQYNTVLTLHRWIYGTKLLDLSVEAIQLEDEGDWELILGVCNFSVLKTLSLCGTSIAGSKRLKRLLGAQYTRLTTMLSKEILSVEIVRQDKATTLCGRLWSTETPEMLRPKKAKAQGF
ncbi:hypothetical protein BG005_001880 [Podila minutissima]|nr:hypothetical protein BG005_001880 [Podila minutissima]